MGADASRCGRGNVTLDTVPRTPFRRCISVWYLENRLSFFFSCLTRVTGISWICLARNSKRLREARDCGFGLNEVFFFVESLSIINAAASIGHALIKPLKRLDTMSSFAMSLAPNLVDKQSHSVLVVILVDVGTCKRALPNPRSQL